MLDERRSREMCGAYLIAQEQLRSHGGSADIGPCVLVVVASLDRDVHQQLFVQRYVFQSRGGHRDCVMDRSQ